MYDIDRISKLNYKNLEHCLDRYRVEELSIINILPHILLKLINFLKLFFDCSTNNNNSTDE